MNNRSKRFGKEGGNTCNLFPMRKSTKSSNRI